VFVCGKPDRKVTEDTGRKRLAQSFGRKCSFHANFLSLLSFAPVFDGLGANAPYIRSGSTGDRGKFSLLRAFESVRFHDFQIVRFFVPYANCRRA
jgi:hypothetical protein